MSDTVGYYVLRDDAPAGGDCGTQASPTASVTCTDSVLASATPMTYAYEVVAVWRSWTSTSDSVDVLVKATQTIVFTSTAPSSAKVGGSTYEVAATGGGSGNPVTFTIDPSASSVCSIAGSTVSFAAVGTCTVNANQAGGSSYEPAGQAQQSFAVSKGDQAIVFTSTAPSSAKVGGSTYEVAATGGGSGNPVTFTIDPSASSVCSIAGSTVSFIAVGTCTVNANQAGGSSYEPAGQVQQSFAVAKGDQTIGFGALTDRRFDEGPVTVSATASSGLTVSFSSATPGVCTVAGTSVTFVAVGTCTVNANQGGDSNWNAATQVQQSFQVTKGDQTIGFGALTDRRFDEGPVTVSATASSGLTVSFSSATPGVCTVAGTGVTFVAVGTCTVNANQGGDSNWNAAPQVQQSFQVTKGNQTVAFTSPAPGTAKVGGPTHTPSGTATSGLAVTLTIDPSSSSVCSIAGGVISFVAVGTCTVEREPARERELELRATGATVVLRREGRPVHLVHLVRAGCGHSRRGDVHRGRNGDLWAHGRVQQRDAEHLQLGRNERLYDLVRRQRHVHDRRQPGRGHELESRAAGPADFLRCQGEPDAVGLRACDRHGRNGDLRGVDHGDTGGELGEQRDLDDHVQGVRAAGERADDVCRRGHHGRDRNAGR